MRAAVERCAELEVLADGRSEALDVAIGKINKAEAALANVTAERDAMAARLAEAERRRMPPVFVAGMPRATPTEGD
jgi:hypothetical protein